MDDFFKIYVEQLRDGRVEKIDESLAPDFLEIQESGLSFNKPVIIKGEAYLAENELILHWNVKVEATVACSICNGPVEVGIHLDDFYHSEPLSEIKTGIYNFKDLLREIILLEVPFFAECGQPCPKRKEYSKYFKESFDQREEEEGYQPFADLDWKL